ncbi:unnamed protein product [Leptosia nina]|uniref:C2H2-type domain-containing protein n=1 Tax=Leptosia nina TaxID=320188 RepID=A0AAV1JXW1_9NEOP
MPNAYNSNFAKQRKRRMSVIDSGANSCEDGNISFEDQFRGFEKFPTVQVERFEISKYLNDLKSKIMHIQSEETSDKFLDLSKFTQHCCVRLVRNDLNELRNMLATNLRTNKENLSNENLENKFKCNICAKTYCNEKKLLNHQENKHLIVYKPVSKPQKRVSFSDQVIVHAAAEYHACRKCIKVFKSYTDLKAHARKTHKKQCDKINSLREFACESCEEKFNDENDMLQHKQIHFYDINDNKKGQEPKLTPKTYKISDPLPDEFKPLVVLQRLSVCKKTLKQSLAHIKQTYSHGKPKAIIDTKAKKTLLSQFQCMHCRKYFSSKSSMFRHIDTLHNPDPYHCNACEEVFSSRSLLYSHRCIRGANIPEPFFDDARPEILLNDPGVDDDSVFFEIPAPIVELKEFDNYKVVVNDGVAKDPLPMYEIVMEEVPIEF